MQSWKRTLNAAFFAQICSITGFTFVLPFLPLYVRELGVADEAQSRVWAGIAFAAGALTMAVFSPIWGALADRYGRKPMVLRAMLGGALVLTLMSFCQNASQLVACRLLQGALTGTVTASVALVAGVVPRHRAGQAMGMMQAAVFVGAAFGPFMGGLLADALGYRATFRAAALVLLAGVVVTKVFVRERFVPSGTADGAPHGTFGQVFAAVGFLTAVFIVFALRFANAAAGPVFPDLVKEVSGDTERINTTIGLLISAGNLMAAGSAWLFGRFSDLWGHKRLLIALSLFASLTASLYLVAGRVAHLFGLRLLFGVGVGGMRPLANAIIRGVTHDSNIGKAYGVTSSASAIGMFAGPLMGGYLSASVSLRAPFVVMAVSLALGAALVAWRVKPIEPAEEPASD
ncbi:MAG: MFS transporter [Candidatus Brocadiia bacterium]